MRSNVIGNGGFYLPAIYQKAQKEVEYNLSQADIDYADLTKWNFPDEFMCFVLQMELLPFVDRTFPNPRAKNEVPIWFLITCQFLMRIYQTGKYQHLRYLLNSGSILTRYGFNVGTTKIGFNDKNKKQRQTAVDADTVRKFFKDTKRDEIRLWYQEDLQRWFKQHHAFDRRGIFILDQSHLVVPNNLNYEEAVKMPVDEHGQLYRGINNLTDEQKRSLIYHPCYALTTLLHVSPEQTMFHVAGYEFGAGNEDELIQAKRLIPAFCKAHPGLIKELILDRGYINGEWISELKQDYHIDTLIPLRDSMGNYQDAIAIAKFKNNWQIIDQEKSLNGEIISKTEIANIDKLELWPNLHCPIYATVIRDIRWNRSLEKQEESFHVLVSTRRYSSYDAALNRYRLRVQIEERFRQWKHDWYISEFPSPNKSLIESHVCFTLFTYSLLQFYFRRNDLQEKTRRFILTLRMHESTGKDAVLVYSRDKYGVFCLDDYTVRVAGMNDTPRNRLKKIMEAQKEERLKRGS